MARAKLQPLALIAEGAQGRVYLAADLDLGRFVAVKLIRLAGDPAETARC
jgi:serine/threonine protein kinase